MTQDDEGGRELLRPLRTESTPPSSLDLAGVVRKGRSRIRARRLLGTAGAVSAVLVVIPLTFSAVQGTTEAPRNETPQRFTTGSEPAPAAPSVCEAQALPLPDWAVSSAVLGGEPTGRYLVGWAEARDGNRKPLLWDRGTVKPLDSPTADVASVSVNSSAVVAGSGRDVRGQQIAWVYRDGQYRHLPQPGEHDGDFVSAVDVNERGDVLGSDNSLDFDNGTGRFSPQQLPLIWPAEAPGTFRRLAAPPGAGMVRANGIEDDGTVVGTWTSMPERRDETAEHASHAVLWSPDGVPRELGGDSLKAIRGGWAVGYRKGDPVLWNLPTGKDTGSRLALAGAVNAHGWVGGQIRQDKTDTPALELGTGKILPLPLPQGAVPGSEAVAVTSLSDDGRVVGGTVQTDRNLPMAVNWACR